MSEAGSAQPPLPARLLGYAGLLPPLGCILGFLYLVHRPDAAALSGLLLLAALVYVALILSFLGGLWWGIAAARLEGEALARWLMTAVMPSLVAWPALLAAFARPATGGGLLAVTLVATLLGDRRLAQAGLVPRWWLRLRVPLSCGLALEVLLVALLA